MRSQVPQVASFLVWFLRLSPLLFSGLAAQQAEQPENPAPRPFALDQIADQFPSKGFENEIAFWTNVFTVFSEKEIIFHDRDDLRIIYRIRTMDRGIRDDWEEARRQRKILDKEQEELEEQLRDIARLGPDSEELGKDQVSLVRVVRANLPDVDNDDFRHLSENVRYQRGVREKFLEGLIRSGRYLGRIEEVFRTYGLPAELALMPHVESSFDYSAYSKVGAAGIWQFMRSTGRRFLTINRYIDERRDPIAATEAAARYLKENYDKLGTWPLAVTAYNHGANGMARAQEQYGDDFRTIVDNYESRYFGFASKNFYPELLAAIEISRNYKDYFGEVEIEQPEEFDTVPLKHGYHVSVLEKASGLDQEVLRAYNPHLTDRVWNRYRRVPAGFQLRLPPGKGESVQAALAEFKPAPSQVSVAADGSMLYRVRAGDTLGRIASTFSTSIGNLQRWNSIADPHRIIVGDVLVVSQPPEKGGGGRSSYRVQAGDSLASIAKKFSTTVQKLLALNNLENPNRIFPGQLLVVMNR